MSQPTSLPMTNDEAQPYRWASTLGLKNQERGAANLRRLHARLGADKFACLLEVLQRQLPANADPDAALNNLERYLAGSAADAVLPGLLEDCGRRLCHVLSLFGASQFFSELLIACPGDVALIGSVPGRSPTRDELYDELWASVADAYEDSAVLTGIRRFRQRHMLRIGVNDILFNRPLDEITRDISRVADAAVGAAYELARRTVVRRFGEPRDADAAPVSGVVLAFGKLGGQELNYSSDIDLMTVYSDEGGTDGRPAISNGEFFGRVMTELVRLLSTHPPAFRVDLRLRPEGQRGPLARCLASTLAYYDTLGRTWERQALIKLRPIAGDIGLGRRFLRLVEPLVFRKYLSFAEINEIKALKRRIERRTSQAGESNVEVKTGKGGIRDIEFAIQFLQLLNGGELPEVRQRNTLKAIDALEKAGCLSDQERGILRDNYVFLRAVEHRLQLLFDLQTHRLPESRDELEKLALRMADWASMASPRAAPPAPESPDRRRQVLEWFLREYRSKTELNRRILNHLLHETFADSDAEAQPESDLLLAPDPDGETIRQVLGRYPFRDVSRAYHNLTRLAQESAPFLSTPRCRHFLASIAPRLLRALAETPDPDMALNNLEKVTASLGAKGVLWELFHFNPPSLKLYVDLCANSQFLCEILIKNPGMIDELLDSLVLVQPRTKQEMKAELAELCRGAEDVEPILHSFQDKEWLRIGVNDILGKEPLRRTLAELTDLAETIFDRIVCDQCAALHQKMGVPSLAAGPRAGGECRFVFVGLGKFGGREMSYNSDLDLILIYEGDGRTIPRTDAEYSPAEVQFSDNFHFFSELGQRIIKASSQLGPRGRLYQIDMRLRPTGRSGSLVVPLAEFEKYHAEGGGQLWERLALTRARVVSGDGEFATDVRAALDRAVYGPPWQPQFADEILHMRQRLEASRSERDLKRGFGGIVDIEFLVQSFQLKFGGTRPSLRVANTYEILDALQAERLLDDAAWAELADNYDFLRRLESRLRMVHNLTQDELPARPEELDQLARRLGFEATIAAAPSARFLSELERRTARVRELFLNFVAALR